MIAVINKILSFQIGESKTNSTSNILPFFLYALIISMILLCLTQNVNLFAE